MFVFAKKFRSLSRFLLAVELLSLFALRASAVEPATTLLLYNINDSNGVAIRDYYSATYPGVRSYGLDLSGFGEEILAQEYLDSIRQPVLDYLNSQSWGAQIDTFVTTKGLPLRIDAGPDPDSSWQRYSSLESELTRIDSINSIEAMGNQNWVLGGINIPGILPANPYYLGPEVDFLGNPIPYAGPKGFDRSDPINENIRLTSRLDGYTLQDVIGMIDRAQQAFVVPFGQTVVVDDHPNAPASSEAAMTSLALNILPSHSQLTDYDATNSPILSSPSPILGYVGHGVHSGLPSGVPGNLDETGYLVESLNFELANGAVFLTYESFNAYSFDLASTSSATAQGQVAQWIAAGGTAGLGHVQEPTASVSTVANEDIFFDMLLSGYTLAEAAWSATRQLSYVNTVVGDPLMRWQAWLPGDVNLDGAVNLFDVVILQDNWLQPGTFAEGDVNGDGMVNLFDVVILQDNWLMEVGSVSAISPGGGGMLAIDPANGSPIVVASIPEPSTQLGFTVVLLGLLLRAAGDRRLRAFPHFRGSFVCT